MSEHIQTIEAFMEQSNTIMAAALPPQTVQVWPGGATFTSIQAAINSITNASPQVQYQVAVGSGTYNEAVTMKDYVYVMGAEQSLTTVIAPGQQSFATGVFSTCNGGGISDLTIKATPGSWGACPIGVKITSNGQFSIKGVTIVSGDSSAVGNNVRGITTNTGAYSAQVLMSQCMVYATGGDSSTCVGIDWITWPGQPPCSIRIDLSGIAVTSGAQSFGVSTANGATATLNEGKITADTWALYDSDNASLITANQCTIGGPVSSGVVVNN
jgi:hypothetical protein